MQKGPAVECIFLLKSNSNVPNMYLLFNILALFVTSIMCEVKSYVSLD